jgi:iron complex transport system substrate-binding protein
VRRTFLALMLLAALPAHATEIKDATGRTVTVPDHPARVLPAGYPASVLLAALAPDLMIGWTHQPSAGAAAFLPESLAKLPPVPRVTFEGAGEAVKVFHPDLVLDYGDVTPRYVRDITGIQTSTGIPSILLDGHLTAAPQAFRLAGQALGRPERGELLARIAEDLLAAVPKADKPLRVLVVRGADNPMVAQPNTLATEVISLLGWTPVAPASEKGGMFRATTVADIAALNPDLLIFATVAARTAAATSPAWQAVPAIKEGHVLIEPEEPFGWIEEPPSINRLLGLAWLSEHGGAADGAMLSALLFNRVPDPAAVAGLRAVLDAPTP